MTLTRQHPAIPRHSGLFLLLLWGLAGTARADSQLDASFENQNVYFTEGQVLRQHTYALELRQETKYSPELRTVLRGWAGYDAAMQTMPPWVGARYSKAVRQDELYDPQMREAFVEYLHGDVSVRVGLQQIDWVDSLAVQTADILTPVDLRQGGYGNASDVIQGEGALLLGHHLAAGWQAEWILVPKPVTDRLPKGPNGYGYGELIEEKAGPGRNVELREKRPADTAESAEGGLRLLKTTDVADITLLAYRGYQRSPSYTTVPLTEDGKNVALVESYQRVNTFGLFLSRASGGYSLRLFTLGQPSHAPERLRPAQPGVAAPHDQIGRYGLGLDYVWSKDLKAYTEAYWTRVNHIGQLGQFGTTLDDNYTFIYRLVNETFQSTELFVEGIVTGPARSYLWSPNVRRTFAGAFIAQAGARYLKSYSDRSQLDVLRRTSQYYLSLTYKLHVDEEK